MALMDLGHTNRIFNEDRICLCTWFSRSSQIFSQNTEAILLLGGESLYSAIREKNSF